MVWENYNSKTKAIESLRMHSGLGGIGRLKLLTMSLWESQYSNGKVSLEKLFENQVLNYSDSPNSLDDIAFLGVRGGWPAVIKTNKEIVAKQASLYLEELCESDIRTVDGHRRSADKMRNILRSYASFFGSNAPNTSIENDLLNDIETFGLIFETLVIRDLKAYAQILDADIYRYRDSTGLECDAVIYCRNGKYALIEAKLSQAKEEEGARTLKALKTKIEKTNFTSPTFLMIITATGFAHKREDGIFVVPIGCLKN